MKKYLLGIFAIIMAIGFSAFTISKSRVTYPDEQTFTWHKYNFEGSEELNPVVKFRGTETQAKGQFDCPEGQNTICARAYNSSGTPLDIFITKEIE